MGETRIGSSVVVGPPRPTTAPSTTTGAESAGMSGGPSSDGVVDAFDNDGPSAARVMGNPLEIFGTAAPELASEMQRRIMEAQLGSGGWSRGPRAGVSRSLKSGKSERSLVSRGREFGKTTEAPNAGAAEPQQGRFKDWSASATVFSAGRIETATLAKKSGSANIAGVQMSGDVHAGQARGMATADAGVDLKSGAVSGTAALRGELHAVGVEGSASRHLVGNDDTNLGAMAWGKAYVGAEAGGAVGVRLSPKDGTAKVSAGVDAFAGAKAVAVLRPSVKIAGEEISSFSGVSVEGYAGVGVKANAEAGLENGRFKAKVELGAALGIGGGVGVNVDVNLVGVANVAQKGVRAGVDVAKDAGRAVADQASAVGNAAASGLNSAGNAISGAFKKARWW